MTTNVENFEKNYYKNFDLSFFKEKIIYLVGKIGQSTEDSVKKKYYTELYANFLQIVEIFCINSFVVLERDLLGNIFNLKIDKKIDKLFLEKGVFDKFTEALLASYVSSDQKDEAGRTKHKNVYKTLIKESVSDFRKDKQFLNSYKHGFRVYGGIATSLYISNGEGVKPCKILDSNTSITYYKLEKFKEKEKIIKVYYQCDINFNWESVQVKSLVLLTILENIKRRESAKSGDIIELGHLLLEDLEKFKRKSGASRFQTAMFVSTEAGPP